MNQNQKISLSLQNFLSKFLDFSGRASQLEHWIGTLVYMLGFSAFYFILTESIENKAISFLSLISAWDAKSPETAFLNLMSSYEDSKFMVFSLTAYIIILPTIFAILVLAFTSSLSRRLRDIGFASGAITILVGLMHLLLILSVPYLSAIFAILVGLILPILATDSILTNNNDGFSKFLFRQNPQATAYYAQFGSQQYAYMPNQNQGFANPQTPMQNQQNQNFVNPNQQVQKPEQTPTPTGQNEIENPFGDKVFKK